MGNHPKVVGLGCCTLDILIRVDTLPTLEQCRQFREIRFDGGGMAATAMAAVSRLGVPAGFVGTAGKDDPAELKLRLLDRYGVDSSRIVRRDRPDDAVVVVFVNAKTGERTFFGGGRQGETPIAVGELDKDYITGAEYLLLDGLHSDAAVAAARWMREAGKTVVLDAGTGGHGVSPGRIAFIQYVDVLISGAGYAQSVTGLDDIREAGARILGMGPRIFVQTEGPNGSHTVTDGEAFHTPVFDVDVVDTTGAGDVFHGAYIVGLAHRWNLRQVSQFATAVSAIKCTRLGGRAGIPSFDEALGFLRSRGIQLDPQNVSSIA